MIASLRGRLEATGDGWAIIDVNGVGLQVFVPTSTMASIGEPGSMVKLYTHLQVREDNLALYGFATFEELGLFRVLTGVSGIGPRLGLAMLSAMKPEQLVSVIASGDTEMLTSVPGVGKKLAARVVLELREKIGEMTSVAPLQMVEGSSDVIGALTALGYSAAEASRAVANIGDTAGLSLEEKVKLALAYFSHE